jgi:hypothetical protein
MVQVVSNVVLIPSYPTTTISQSFTGLTLQVKQSISSGFNFSIITPQKEMAKNIHSTKAAEKTPKNTQPIEGDNLEKKRRNVHKETDSSYIYKGVYPYNHKRNLFTIQVASRILKQVHPDTGISNKTTRTDQL